MARYTGAVCKQCRREGKKLFLKGDRCYTGKCGFERRSYAPGQHGQGRKKSSEYGIQLRAKQTARRYYGIPEKQFRNYFEIAEKKQGVTGYNLLKICESRLDNVVYTAAWGKSRAQARQLVTHGHFTVNGKSCDIPSRLLKEGDVVAIKPTSLEKTEFKTMLEESATRPIPQWLAVDGTTAKVERLPEREEITVPVEEHLIVELYSK